MLSVWTASGFMSETITLLQHQDKYRPDQPDRAERLVSGRRAGPPTAVVCPADLGESSETGQPCFSSIQMVYNPRSVKEPLAILRADIDARRVQGW